MWEWLAIATGAELGKFALTQMLDLSESVLEAYVQDFFKDCIQSGVARLNAATLKPPMAEAIGYFIKRFIKELLLNEVPQTSIDHHYRGSIKRFVRDKTVGRILGKAFDTKCKKIDFDQLKQIWTQQYEESEWLFPADDFDWRGVAKEYVFEVKGIIKANGELRAVLQTELQEQQTASLKQLAGRPVRFDLSSYREAILEQYGSLRLESLGSSQYERQGINFRAVSLWNVFVAQNARDCQEYVPQTYEIPKDQLKRRQQFSDVDALAEGEAEIRRERYGQQPVRSILEIVGAVNESPLVQPADPYLVILGDPGSGKSTLLRYLAVSWARKSFDEQIPLLIELRGYSQSRSRNECQDFVEFVHKGSNWVSHLDQHRLDEWLTQGKALVMLDGLDEVVDRQQRDTILKQIHDFTQRYSRTPVLLTSRVIGYRAQRLSEAGFQHFMLQDLDDAQVENFLESWHDLTQGEFV